MGFEGFEYRDADSWRPLDLSEAVQEVQGLIKGCTSTYGGLLLIIKYDLSYDPLTLKVLFMS